MVVESLPFWLAASSLLGLLLYGAGKLVRARILVPKFTILHDIQTAGRPREDGKIPGRAIVCGGSVAGLLAAAVCADHFESVFVVEPEQWANEHGTDLPQDQSYRTLPDGHKEPIVARTRIMQYTALHFFQAPTLMGLEALFPNLDEELDNFGYMRHQLIIRARMGGIPCPEPYDEGDPKAPKGLNITREQYETLVRRLLVRSRPNVKLVTGTVTGYIREAGVGTLKGVIVRTRDLREEKLSGRFIVDATGTQQMSYHKWLKQVGFDVPSSIRIEYDPHMLYSQSVRTIPAKYHATLDKIIPQGFQPGVLYNHPPDWKTGEQRALYVILFQDSQLIITMGGWDVDLPPHTIAEVRPYVTSLYGAEHIPSWLLELLDWLEEHEQEVGFCPWSTRVNAGPLSWVRYHNVDGKNGTLPTNWVAVGDAVMKLNPVYGQGCSKANLDVITLDGVLRATPASGFGSANVSGTFFKSEAPRVAGAWDGTKSNDYGYASTKPAEGETLDHDKFGRDFGRAVQQTGIKHRDVQSAFWHVTMFLAPGTDLMSPWMLGKILFNQLVE